MSAVQQVLLASLGAKEDRVVTYLDSRFSASATNSHLFSGIVVGAAASDRYIVVTGFATVGQDLRPDVTIADIQATVLTTGRASTSVSAFIAYALVPSGTSITVKASWSQSSTCGIGVFSAVGFGGIAVRGSASNTIDIFTSGTVNTPLSAPANPDDVCFWVAGINRTFAPSITATASYSGASSSFYHCGGFFVATSSSAAVTASTSNANGASMAASLITLY